MKKIYIILSLFILSAHSVLSMHRFIRGSEKHPRYDTAENIEGSCFWGAGVLSVGTGVGAATGAIVGQSASCIAGLSAASCLSAITLATCWKCFYDTRHDRPSEKLKEVEKELKETEPLQQKLAKINTKSKIILLLKILATSAGTTLKIAVTPLKELLYYCNIFKETTESTIVVLNLSKEDDKEILRVVLTHFAHKPKPLDAADKNLLMFLQQIETHKKILKKNERIDITIEERGIKPILISKKIKELKEKIERCEEPFRNARIVIINSEGYNSLKKGPKEKQD